MAAAAAAAGAATPPAGQRRGPGRPPGSRSGKSKSKSTGRKTKTKRRGRSLRWSKPPKGSSSRSSSRPPPPRPHSSSASPPGPHSSPASPPPPHSASPPAARRGSRPAPAAVDLSAPLPPGTDVEVRVDDDGFHGSWFEATVLDFAPARGYRHPARYTVRYAHLLADDDEGVLAEPFAPSHIRPRPPPPPPDSAPRFRPHDVVEAFHHEGWWSGIVVSSSDPSASDAASASAASDGGRVTVAFPITREVIEFAAGLVRPRRDYVDGDWIPSRCVVSVRPARAVRVYEAGEKVEVVRQRDLFGESWFPATVRRAVDDLSYVVEYFDLEEDGDGDGAGAGAGKAATEYLHWQFIRPAVEHAVPGESEFQLRPGAAVEAYCDGAWSPGVVRRVLEEGEYEIAIVANKSELRVTKVVPLLKPQYKWNGKQWRIATRKRRANTRQRSVSGKSPRSPVVVSSSDEEHNLGQNTSVKGSEHALVSEMDIPLSAMCKSPESYSPDSFVSEKNCPQGSHGIVNSVPMNGVLCASPGHSAPVDNQEILSDMVVTDGDGPVSGRSVDGHDVLSIAELREKMNSARRNSAVIRKQENIVKSLRVNKSISDIKAGKTHPIQELQGKIQSKGNMISSTPEVVLALCVSGNGQTILSPDRLVSVGTKRGSRTKVLACKKLAKRRGSKELGSSNNSMDVIGTVQQREVSEPIEECPLVLDSPKSGTLVHNITELLNQDLLPMVPPGFKSTDNGKGTNINDIQLDEEPTGTTNSFIATKSAESNHVIETTILPAEQSCRKLDGRSVLQNAQSSQCTIESSPLRICSASESESLLPSPQPLSQVSSALFVKNSPMWHLVDTMHVFKEFPQQPHFLTLQKHPPLLREGMALGMMLSFSDLVKITMEASIDNSMEWFEDKIKTISYLADNGFDVQFMQSIMTDLVKIKSEFTSYDGEIGKLGLKMVEKTALSSRVGALLDEKDTAAAKLEQELGRIRQESQKIAEEKEKIDAETASIKTTLSGYEDLRSGAKRKFEDSMSVLRRKRLS